MRAWSFKLIAGALLVSGFTGLAMAQTAVADHWSPYDYPKQIPDGSKFHIIAEGDTLWSLAATYLGDPLLWPSLYQANTYIQDPDLIYPGDPLLLDVGVVVNGDSIAESLEEQQVEGEGSATDTFAELDEFADGSEGEGSDEDSVSDRSEVSPFGDSTSEFVILPAGVRADLECSTYLYTASSSKEKLPFDFLIAGGENRLIDNLGTGDIIYLNKGMDQGVQPGEEYSVRHLLEPVFNPEKGRRGLRTNGKFLGFAIDQVGRVRILATQASTSTALIVDSCSSVTAGDFLVPYEQEPIPLITELPVAERYQDFKKDGSGLIVISEDNVGSFGKDHLTNIDMGYDQNVAPGDIFIIYRSNPNSTKNITLPDLYLGHGVALKANASSTIMKVIEGYSEIHVGDKVVPFTSAKMEE